MGERMMWGLAEIMGHRSRAGRLSEVTFAGSTLLQVETMGEGESVLRTELYAPSAIFCITPCDEETARRSGVHVGPVAALSPGRPLDGEVPYDDEDGGSDSDGHCGNAPVSFRGEGGWAKEMLSTVGRRTPPIAWIICGGESGPKHRPLNLDHARDMRDQCRAAEVPFFFKQVGGRTPTAGGDQLDGQTIKEFPGV
jgi:hypothetical protein